MVFTPYHNTIRGLCSKVTCMALFVWIVQQGYKVGWRTTTHNELGMFLYHAVSNEWILTHAVYRFVLVTLATFSRRIRYLEFYTAIIVLILHRRVNSLPMRYLFGMADTIVVPILASMSSIYEMWSNQSEEMLQIGVPLDLMLGIVQLLLAGYTVYRICLERDKGK
ncbi:hypothetical protein O9G_005889 [Rozella allomycis CSF55]|uniref:Uncharacterized protein n=1 Tax=Rozella allomycis (strain CSF55) TaxID=988480 RepID=A0A075B4V8_ROZAC|nr:hypothetical protein O9G_005889 [Rozella allomycis CSF55]|eukprot:EPZ36676.1 hypothetical protein O9G_005889 [Rozella allomycis CSF55]